MMLSKGEEAGGGKIDRKTNCIVREKEDDKKGESDKGIKRKSRKKAKGRKTKKKLKKTKKTKNYNKNEQKK